MTARLSTEDFIARARAKHGDRYDYSRVEYAGNQAKVEIICRKHGSFQQASDKHWEGQGCPRCRYITSGGKKRLTQADFLERARAVHGDRYDYSKVEYASTKSKVEIVCQKHGSFWQPPSNHWQGHGCPYCKGEECRTRLTKDTQWFILRAYEKHGDCYDYSRATYLGSKTKAEIVCRKHGSFFQTPNDHLRGYGCGACKGDGCRERRFGSLVDFIARARAKHDDRYGYDRSTYRGCQKKTEITCHKHGSFFQTPNDHLTGYGCPSCGRENAFPESRSKEELEVFDFVRSILPPGIEVTYGALDASGSLFDVLVPARGVAIEYNGCYWHSYPRARQAGQHRAKRALAEDAGYRLISIWSDTWHTRRGQVQDLLRRALGVAVLQRIGARQCALKAVDWPTARDFHAAWHMQGVCAGGSHHYGLFFENALVAVATFQKHGSVLARYTLAENVSLPGGLPRILKHHRATAWVGEIKTFCDRDLFDGRVYAAAGFEKAGCSLQLSYWSGGARQRREAFMKHKVGAADDPRREIDINAENGVFACYNSGVDRWVLPSQPAPSRGQAVRLTAPPGAASPSPGG